jgi:putative tryptophan/tyrosine transport system substrate-binding protein
MSTRTIVVLLVGLALASVHLAYAQEPAKISRIGYLAGTSAAGDVPRFEAFRQGLRALGHVEGKNIAIESRYTEGKFDQLAELAAEKRH